MASDHSAPPHDEGGAAGMLKKLLRPWTGAQAEQLAAVSERVSEIAGATGRMTQEITRLQKLLYREHEAIKDQDERVSAHLGKLSHNAAQGLESVHRTLEQQAGVLGRLVQRVERADELEVMEGRILRRIDRIGRSSRPILVGPWTGEIGFELLYWIPFVRWAAERMGAGPERLVVMSRGGTAAWYGGLAGRYLDVFNSVSADSFREATRPQLKQRRVGALDARLIRAARGAGLGLADLLHPSLMYDLFYPAWKQVATVSRITEHSRYARPLAPAPLPEEIRRRLPDRYIAVRFYFSQCFPATPENTALASALVKGLAARMPVVLLQPGMRPDDHDDLPVGEDSRIVTLGAGMLP